MSDVTGNIGNESVRLRGMALEDTQYQILKELESLTYLMDKDNKKQGTGADKAAQELKKLGGATNVAADQMAKQPGMLGKMGKAISDAKGHLQKFSNVFGTFDRTIRGYDSNIRDSSFAMRQVAVSSRGAMGALAKFSSESISQLEEQFDMYKRLSNIGGVTATDFENMRVNAAKLGVNMSEYASIMESNFVNLRLGGKSAGASMKNLSSVVTDLRDSGESFNNQMIGLGFGVSDYGQLVMEQTLAMGGLNKAISDTSKPFSEKILNATKNVTALSDAFGFNRDMVMKSANDALKDARNRVLFNSIQNKGKTEFLNAMTGLLGDSKKGMDVALSVLTGQYSEEAANLTSWAPDLMDSFKVMSQYLAEAPGDLEGAMKKANFDSVVQRLKKDSVAMGASTRFSTDASNQSVLALLNLVDMYGESGQAVERFKERLRGIDSDQAKQLTQLGTLQQENVKLAITFAKTNKVLNQFGLTAGFAMQLLTKVMGKAAQGGMTAFQDAFKEMGGPDFVKEMTSVSDDVIKNFSDGVVKSYTEALKQAGVETETTKARPRADMPNYGPVVNDNPVNVQGRMVKPSELNKSKLEAVRGGPTSVYMQQLVAAIGNLDPNIRVTGLDDDYHKDGKHTQGLALDFTIPDQTKSEMFKAKIQNMMDKLGIKDGDYYIQDEYKNPSAGATGGHMHVQFKNAESAKKFYEQYGAKYGKQDVAAPTNPAPAKPSAPPKKVDAGDTKVSFSDPTANSGVQIAQGSVNTGNQITEQSFDIASMVKPIVDAIKEEGTLTRQAYDIASYKVAMVTERATNSTT